MHCVSRYFAQLARVHVVGLLVDIHKLRQCSRLRDRFGRGDKRVGNGHDNVPALHSRRHQREAQRVGSAVDGHRTRRLAKLGKLFFKSLDHRPADKTRRADDLLKNRRQLRFQLNMRRDQIEKRNILRGFTD